ncbi:MAG: hypothetical protein ABIN79_00940 [Marmoricola sp.]
MSTWAGASAAERRIARTCAGVALAAAIVIPVLWTLSNPFATRGLGGVFLVYSALEQVASGAALVAVVLTRIRWVGVSIAVSAALVSTLAGSADFLLRGGDPGVVGILAWLVFAAISGLRLLAADLVAQRLDHFTAATGAMAGVLVGALGGVIGLIASAGSGAGSDLLGLLPTGYWVVTFGLVPVLLGAIGLVAGHLAAQRGRVSA